MTYRRGRHDSQDGRGAARGRTHGPQRGSACSQGLAELSRSTKRGRSARDQGVHAHARTLMTGLTTRRAAARHLATPRRWASGRSLLFDGCAHGRGGESTDAFPAREGGLSRGRAEAGECPSARSLVGAWWSWPEVGAGTEIEVSDARFAVRENGLPSGVRRGLPGLKFWVSAGSVSVTCGFVRPLGLEPRTAGLRTRADRG